MHKLYLIFLILLPKNILTRFVGYLADKKISKLAIKWFCKKYDINTNEIEKKLSDYQTLNEFFTRKLAVNAREISSNEQEVISPVDGVIAQMGNIDGEKLIQAKGRTYALKELLGSNELNKYDNGFFMTIYLSPQDYHRIHHFCDSEIIGYDYIPGYLFPVNPFSVNNVNNLFAVNERLVTYYKCNQHHPALVKVGATIVGKIKVNYDNTSNITHRNKRVSKIYDKSISVNKGDELGYFAMGSTVIILFEKNSILINENLKINNRVALGDLIGKWQTK